MFTLFVSHNCGGSYRQERSAETVEELRPRMAELNADMMRWYLEKDGEDYWEEACGIHKDIMQFMEQVEHNVLQPF